MQNKDHRLAQLIAQAADDAHKVGCMVNIQIVGRFIQQDILGVLRNDHGNIGALPLTAGQFIDELLLKIAQFHVGDSAVNDLVVLLGQPSAGVRKAAKRNQFPDSQLHLDIVGLGQDGEPLAQLPAFPARDLRPLKIHNSAVPCDQAGQHSHHGGFSRTVRADKGKDFAFRNFKTHAIDNGFAIVAFGDLFYKHGVMPFSG